MIEMQILGFVAERPMHGYELRRRIEELSGYARPVSDGTLYPAINRLASRGWVERTAEAGIASAGRQLLSITDAGRGQLRSRLAEPTAQEITDFNRFSVLLAFLSLLPDAQARATVLRRRLAFLEAPAGFFFEDGKPLRKADVADPYRRGLITIAAAHSRAERAWLREALELPAMRTVSTS